MKAITLWQPWASAIPKLWKKFETRSWATKYRGPLAIHAALRLPDPRTFSRMLIDEMAHLMGPEWFTDVRRDFPRCAVVAIVDLVDCVPTEHVAGCAKFPGRFVIGPHELAFGDYTPGRWAWRFENIRPLLEPIRVLGHQRLWEWQAPGLLFTGVGEGGRFVDFSEREGRSLCTT